VHYSELSPMRFKRAADEGVAPSLLERQPMITADVAVRSALRA
jgi:hypothetical protein